MNINRALIDAEMRLIVLHNNCCELGNVCQGSGGSSGGDCTQIASEDIYQPVKLSSHNRCINILYRRAFYVEGGELYMANRRNVCLTLSLPWAAGNDCQ